MKYITGGLFIFFLLVQIYLLFRLWLEGHRERIAPSGITGEKLPAELREDALRPLRQLNEYYEKRDPEQADACINETMLPEELLILGTNPREIFYGREGAKRLLQGDWRYWGQLALDIEQTALSRAGSALYFVMRGQIRLDIWRFRLPIRITGILEKPDKRWLISKLQFINNLNTNYVIIAWVPALALMASLLLFGLSWLPSIY
ncbi:MAG: nuclear transport factor 2 family protein [Muribaculum sp.]|nr:nuclear transport factor 2 family protein [Ruminococcus flavefaciens]MCM1373641.1 nuclear transport factor 2 family protein [Muribaculum sp.]